ncbi:MAG: DUF2252 family protein [Polyangiaceae bacterium]|nr:DUF2252 family protein [Polyangiaceae bacterium]
MRGARYRLASLTLSAFGLCGLATCVPPPNRDAAQPRTPRALATSTPEATAVSVELPARDPLGDLDVDPTSFDFKGHPELVGRIGDSPHAYFRFTQRLFARAACKRFESMRASLPLVRLHGDPHVEQYFVSDIGRGLNDFDDASVGPSVMDLTRFAASTLLAAKLQGLDDAKTSALLDELFRGYRAGLEGKSLAKTPPAFAGALAAKFSNDKKGFVLYLENQLENIDDKEDSFVREEVKSYAEVVAKREPKHTASFFQIKKLGRTKLGIGSALTRKYIVVLEGQSPKDDDDVVVEVKEIADLTQIPCVTAIPSGAADARASMQQSAGNKTLLWPTLLPNGKFWVNEWLTNYEEARIKKLMPTDLSDLVYEAGLTLAAVHRTPLPDGTVPSSKALDIDASVESEVRKVAKDLADATTKGWERFRREVKGT